MSAEQVLKARFPSDVVDALLSAYREIESNFALKRWKASELDAGHFVEAARRMLEHVLTGSHTPIAAPISKFTDQVLKAYEQAQGDESYRMLIPRALKAIYNIRNKRGVGHIAGVSPNEMDATYILYTVKWVLAEFVRLSSGLSVPDTQKIVDALVERRLSVLWKEGDVTRVLDTKMRAVDQILVLLYDRSPQSVEELRAAVEYKNATKFKQLVKELHRKRHLYRQPDDLCVISPTGLAAAERLLQKAVLGV